MQIVAAFGHKTKNTHRILKKLYAPKATQLIAVVDENGVEIIENCDLTQAVPGSYNRPSNSDSVFYSIIVEASRLRVDLECRITQGESLPANLNVTLGNIFPEYIYKITGETNTPETPIPANLSWITTETPSERATRIKNATVLDLNTRLNTVAKNFHTDDLSNEAIARRNAFYKTDLHLLSAPDLANADQLAESKHATNMSLCLARLIGLGKHLIDLFAGVAPKTHYNPDDGPWGTQTNFVQGQYAKYQNKSMVAKDTHESGIGNADLPTGTEGRKHWDVAKLAFVPAKIKPVTGAEVTIDISTGAGLEEVIKVIETEFQMAHSRRYALTRPHQEGWTSAHEDHQLHKVNTTTGDKGDQVLDISYTGSPSQSVSAHELAMWNELYSKYQDILNWVAPSS